MNRFKGFRLRSQSCNAAKVPTAELPAPVYDEAARDCVLAKINAMAASFDAMSEMEYEAWIDALPRDEFIELIAFVMEMEDRCRNERLETV